MVLLILYDIITCAYIIMLQKDAKGQVRQCSSMEMPTLLDPDNSVTVIHAWGAYPRPMVGSLLDMFNELMGFLWILVDTRAEV